MLHSRSPPKSKCDTITGGSIATLSTTTAAAASSSSAAATLATSGSCALSTSNLTSSLSPLQSGNSTCRTGSTLSLYSNSSTTALLSDGSCNRSSSSGIGSRSAGSIGETTNLKSTNHLHHHSYGGGDNSYHSHHHHPHHHQHHYHQHSHGHHYGESGGSRGSRNGSHRSSVSSSTSSKRGKKNNWGSRERAGMSFLIVIAFFAVFGLIILTELFMIDEKTHGGMIVLRHGNQGSRMGDSMPDYDNVKDDYDLLDDSLLSDSKLGFIQFHDNKLKIQDASNGNAGRQAGVLLNSPVIGANGYGAGAGIGGGGGSANVPIIPWGQVLPTKIEETLPRYPFGMTPTDGSWQVVNGTRFKFFVFSAYYDRRDGAKLVRIVGATKTRSPERVWCRFWYASQRNGTGSSSTSSRLTAPPRYTSATVMARVKIIRENWNLKYSACFVLCPIRIPGLDLPQYVSVVSRLRAPPGNFLELRNTDWDADFATPTMTMTTTSNHSSSSSSSDIGSNGNRRLHGGGARQRPLNSSAPSGKSFSPLPTGDQIADKIAICVKPFHFNYDQALYLMEYLEFYALMGVSHFTFYNHTIGPHATCVLQHYMSGDVPGTSTVTDAEYNPSATVASTNAAAATSSQQQQQEKPQTTKQEQRQQHRISTNYVKPTINILPWNLRMRSQKEIRTEGLFAALNDCLYRTMYRYKYLALVDLDEFIIPRHNDTLNELINSLNIRFRNRNTGAYSFQNAFFYLQFADDPLVYQEPEKSLNPKLRAALVTQRKTRRRFKLHPQKQRSKYICKPEAVIEAGNHFVWEFSPGKGSLNVPPTDAILHHYRVCEFGGNDCIKAPSTIDRTATKYANRLLQRVDAVYNYLKGPCSLSDLPDLPKQPPAVPLQPVVSAVANALKPTKTRITKLFNDFKSKLRETLNRDTANNERNHTLTNTTRGGGANITKSTEKSAAKSTGSNARTPNADYVNFKEKQQHKVVVFEQDEEGQTVVKVKYVKKENVEDKMHKKN